MGGRLRETWQAFALQRWVALALTVGSFVLAVTGWIVYGAAEPDRVDVFALQFAAGAETARDATRGLTDEHITALAWDFVLIPLGYALPGVVLCALGATVFFGQLSRRVARGAVAAFIGAALADVVENVLLWWGLRNIGHAGDAVFEWATAAAVVKLALLACALPVALAAGLIVIARGVGHLRPARLPPDGDVLPPPLVMSPDGDRWPVDGPENAGAVPGPRTRWHNARNVPKGRTGGRAADVGFCVSGGGIRSGCVTLGALQALRGELCRARYLVSVSGGGYVAGAMQLALQPLKRDRTIDPDLETVREGDDTSGARPRDVFAAGTVEEDHARRHGRYIADSVGQWAGAAAVLLRGLLMNLALAVAVVLGLGGVFASAYEAFPVSDLSTLDDWSRETGCDDGPEAVQGSDTVEDEESGRCLPPFPGVSVPALWMVGGLPAVAGVLWLVTIPLREDRGTIRRAVWWTGRALVVTALAVAVLVVVVPALTWAAVAVKESLLRSARVTASTAAGAVGLTYVGALTGILWRRREQLGGVAKWFTSLRSPSGDPGLVRAVPGGLLPRLLVWAVLLVLGAVFLLLFGWAVGTAPDWSFWSAHVGWSIAVPVVVLLVLALVDQTWMSLHPFYRRRLAAAFAVRRDVAGAREVARPYDFDAEPTTLSAYARRRPQEDFPQVIFAAAANLSGTERTPPGARAASFTFSHDYVGGAEVGWVRTGELEKVVSPAVRRDLTVQSAVAVSGAAFASAMGRQARAFQTLFALSNARLGTWLPNPGFLAHHLARCESAGRSADGGRTTPSDGRGDWYLPRLPRIRRFTYLLREILGSYPFDERMLLITDGGHYDNLGLVELLRHGCKRVYCIDASGDAPPFATTLAETITLARQELGVEIELDDPLGLVPGSAVPLEPEDPLSVLNSRLSRKAVAVGRIRYPEELTFEDGTTGRTGTLVFAKALLTPEMTYDLLSYSVAHPVFPRDSTGDQWFDHGQFDAYVALGRFLGEEAGSL